MNNYKKSKLEDPLYLAKKMIKYPSVTPRDEGILLYLELSGESSGLNKVILLPVNVYSVVELGVISRLFRVESFFRP